MKIKSLFALCLVLITVVSCLSVSVSAASGFLSAGDTIVLDNGNVLSVPASAVDETFVIVKNHYQSGFGASDISYMYQYKIYEFNRPAVEGSACTYRLFKSDSFRTDAEALTDTSWEFEDVADDGLVLSMNGFHTIVYSSHDYKNDSGGIIYPASDPNTTDIEVSNLYFRPSMSYDNLLPSVEALQAQGNSRTDNPWIIVRFPKTFTLDYADDGSPIFDGSNEWQYHLYFLAGYKDASWTSINTDPTVQPDIHFNASVVYQYVLQVEDVESYYLSDDVLSYAASNGKSSWAYSGSKTDYLSITDWFDKDFTWNGDLFEVIDTMFVGASQYYYLPAAGPFFNSSLLEEPLEYSFEAITFEKSLFSGFDYDSSTGEVVDGQPNWLVRIYNAIVAGFNNTITIVGNGFQSVIDKLDGLGGANTDDETLDEDISEEEEKSFSLKDIIKKLWEAFLKIVGGLFGFLLDSFTSLISGIGNFFDALSDTRNELFSLFDSDQGSFHEATSFFDFVGNLWLCIPTPIRQFIYFAFATVLFFAMLRMFH